jgi:hypothetical protein
MAKKKIVTGVVEKDDPLASIRDKFKKAMEYWSDDREAMRDDIRFRAGDQWPDKIKAKRERDQRPCLTVDKLNQYVRQIVNDGRQNRPSIKVRPVDSGADIPTAEVFQGIIRHIEDRSNADAAYDTALDSSATGGKGYFRVVSEYVGDDTFDQELCIKRIRNPLTVVIDPLSKEADGSDMKYAWLIDEMDKDDFEATYPDKTPDDWELDAATYGDWFGETVRVAEYWWIEETEREVHLLDDGSVIDEEKRAAAIEAGLPLMVMQTRKLPKRKVKHCLMSGKEYLEEPKEWPGTYIPLLVVYGNEIDVEGKVVHSGIIRPAKDAQRLYNYSRSAFAERVALTPKAPWVAAEGQVEDYEQEWNTANSDNHSVLRYKPQSLNGTPVPPPQRVSATDIPSGFAQDMQISEHDIQGAIGMYAASLGAPSNERSGKAIMARQREGDVGTFHYHDNLNRAIRHCGRILVELIPKFYDSNRVVRILGYDGSVDSAEINPMLPTASQKIGLKMMYNLGVGKYDVSISTGPSYNTLRQEKAEAMTEMVQAAPQLLGVVGDLLVKNMDWPGSEEIAERLQLALIPPVQQAIQAKKQNQGESPEVAQVRAQYEQMANQVADQVQQMQAEMQKMAQENQALKASQEAAMATVQVKAAEVGIKEQELRIKEFEAETERIKVMAEAQLRGAEIESQAMQAQMQPMEQEHVERQEAVQTPQQPPVIINTGPIEAEHKPKTIRKTARAVKQSDGSWVMESIEQEEMAQGVE